MQLKPTQLTQQANKQFGKISKKMDNIYAMPFENIGLQSCPVKMYEYFNAPTYITIPVNGSYPQPQQIALLCLLYMYVDN